jgi:hypothetical protein
MKSYWHPIQSHIIAEFNRIIKDKPDLERPEISGDLDHISVNTGLKEPHPAIRQSSIETNRKPPYIRTTNVLPFHQDLTSPNHFELVRSRGEEQ